MLRKITIIFFTIGIIFSLSNAFANPQQQLNPVQQKTLKNWSHSLAMQAATWGSPIVTMYTLRYRDALSPNAKAAPNTIWRMENIAAPKLSKQAGYVTPSANTVYGFGFMDLRQEPIILEAPDSHGRYYMIEIVDMWTNAFAYVGGKATGYKGGTFALVGPNWQGSLPPDVTRIDCPTPWVLVQPRVHIYKNKQLDLTGTQHILNNIKTTGLAAYLGQSPTKPFQYHYPAPIEENANLPVSALNFKDPLQFWEILSIALNENPPPEDQIEALLPLFEPLGLEFGRPWDRNHVLPEVLASMEDVAKNIGQLLSNLPIGTAFKGLVLPPPSIGNFGTDYQARAVVARMGLTANTPYEAIYWIYVDDENQHVLNGDHQYTITFEEPLPYYDPGFWSLTLYDRSNNYTVANPINRYMIGSDSKDVKKNKDGSFTLYIQKENPGKEKESNWLPAPEGVFYLIARVYAPKPELITILTNPNAWPIPVVSPNVSNNS